MSWVRFKGSVIRPTRTIDSTTVKEIARLAKIDATRPDVCNGLFVNLRTAINVAWSATLAHSMSVYQAPVLEKLSSWRDAIATIKKLSNPDPDSPADLHALGQIRASLSRKNRGALHFLEDDWVPLLDDLDSAAADATEFVRRKYQLKGRPPGGGGNVEANIFIKSLLHAIDAAEGNLTFSREGQGTLVCAVDLLRRHLPGGLLPPANNVRFYEIARREVKAELKSALKIGKNRPI